MIVPGDPICSSSPNIIYLIEGESVALAISRAEATTGCPDLLGER